MRTSNWAYMKYGDGSEELYDMKKASKQFVNLDKSTQHAKILQSPPPAIPKRLEAKTEHWLFQRSNLYIAVGDGSVVPLEHNGSLGHFFAGQSSGSGLR